MWVKGSKQDSLDFLQKFTGSLASDVMRESNAQPARAGLTKQRIIELSKLVARCYLKQGEWQVELKNDWSSVCCGPFLWIISLTHFQKNIQNILQAYFLSTHYDPSWYKAWHTWALANFDVIADMEGRNQSQTDNVAEDTLVIHVVQAVEGAFFFTA